MRVIKISILPILSLMDEKRKSKINFCLKAYGKNDPKPKINWEDKKERQELLSMLVSDVKEVLSHVDVNPENIDTQLKDAADLLAKIVSQDIEEDKDKTPKIKKELLKIGLSLPLILRCVMAENLHLANSTDTKSISLKM